MTKHTVIICVALSIMLLFSYLLNAIEQEPQTVATPVFIRRTGSYDGPQIVKISCSTKGATILYTTDGRNPTASSTIYVDPIEVISSTTITAQAFKDGWLESAISSASYNIFTPTKMIHVPAGTFIMGDTRGKGKSDELPTHKVTLNSFYIGMYPVTQEEYEEITGYNPSEGWDNDEDPNFPVFCISWYDAIEYCNLRSIREGMLPVYSILDSTNPMDWGEKPEWKENAHWNMADCNWKANGYRLPTEAEWEYAARGATNDPDYLYSGSDDIDEVSKHSRDDRDYDDLNFCFNYRVGSKAPNSLGIYDMSGNVLEWCWDRYDELYYVNSPSNNPTGPMRGSNRVCRGGFDDPIDSYRVSWRRESSPYSAGNVLGFRICRNAFNDK